MMTTDRIVVERAGGSDVLRLKSFELSPPAPSEIQIRVGVAFADVMVQEGR